MKKVSKRRLLFAGLVVTFTLVIVLTSFSYFPKARLLPLVVGIPTLIFSILALIGEIYPKLLRLLDVSLIDYTAGGLVKEEESLGKPKDTTRQVLNLSLWLTGFFILVYLVGFLISIGVFGLLFLKVYGKVGWLKAIVVTAGTWGFIVGMFEVFMKVELFQGVLFGAIVPPI